MQIIPLKSKLIEPCDNITEIIISSLKDAHETIKDKDIMVITSKVIALTTGQKIKLSNYKSLWSLIKKEADYILSKDPYALTIKNNILIPNAGIDASNAGEGSVILWPKYPKKEAFKILKALKIKFQLKNLGIIISDSHCVPLRRGVTGIALSYAGFCGIKDYRGGKDLFGRKMLVSEQNTADLLTSAALLVMGESNERIPFTLIRGAKVKFTNSSKIPDLNYPPEKCLFRKMYPKGLLQKFGHDRP